jgi:nucleoside-diphosphate-sugar epimerase
MQTATHVVLGASGGAGHAITLALHDAGHVVRAVNRSGSADVPDGVQRVSADITTEEGARRAMAGADVVYMAAQPPYHRWPQEFPAMLDRVIAAVPDGAKLVMADNLYSYGPAAGPMSESTPERAADAKGRVRREMAQHLLGVHRDGRIRVAIGRASDYFGPRAENSGITALAIEPVTTGKALRWVATLDAPHSAAYLPDIARAYVALGTREEADGAVWILPHAPAVTGGQFLALVNQCLPEPLRTGVVSPTMLRLAAPFHRISRETLGILHQWAQPFVVDDSAFRSTFGPFEVTPLDEAVRATVAAHRARAGTAAR